MKLALQKALFLLLILGISTGVVFAQSGSISGTITDADNGDPLVGASVVLRASGSPGMIKGTATGLDGSYEISGVDAGAYDVAVTYVGYAEKIQSATVSAGQSVTIDFSMDPVGFEFNPVVVTASRQAEKSLDAPSAISVIDIKQIENAVAPSSAALLTNVTGLDMSKTGVGRTEVVLRGFNNAFSGATYTLTDYRQASSPSLGVNVYSIMPNASIDLEQVEVVRGPGAALYGPGVDAGVVHFITKDPFRHPGTTVSIAGGERALLNGALRHAGTFGNFGYKVVGTYTQANDWELDSTDVADAAQLATDHPDRPRDYNYKKWTAYANMYYKFGNDGMVTIGGGTSSLTGGVLSGIGMLQAKNFGITYGQVRFQMGNFFAQAYINKNNNADSYVYSTGIVNVDFSTKINFQAQYDLSVMNGKENLIFGIDAVQTDPDSEGTITGRNEEIDRSREYGAYVQSLTHITDKIDLTLAIRGDYNDIVDETQFSPRAAFVLKPAPGHNVRFTFNRAFSSPGTNSLFLDLPAVNIPFTAEEDGARIILYGQGVHQGITFNNFRDTNQGIFSLPVPGLFGTPVDVNAIPSGAILAVVAASAAPALIAGADITGQGFPASVNTALGNLMGYMATVGTMGATTLGTTLGISNASSSSGLGYDAVGGPTDVDPLKQTTSQTFEVGYKGIFGGKLLFAVDAYQTKKENFVGPLRLESPFAYLGDSGALTAEMAGLIAGQFGASADPALGGLISTAAAELVAIGIPADQATATVIGVLGGIVGGGVANTPVAIVQPDHVLDRTDNPNIAPGFLSYRNFGELKYWGVDISAQYIINEKVNAFANMSIVSDDFFDNEELGEEDEALFLALNAPKLKIKFGASYTDPGGMAFKFSGRHVDGFPIRSGPYVGDLPSYFLLDLGMGYDLDSWVSGMRVDLDVQNVLNEEHREFVGAPKLGRQALVRLNYNF